MTGLSVPHADLPSIATARLPAVYEAAKNALAECSRIDECMEWANKAAALASYAKQAGDEEMEKMARRIRGRAIRRCGELLKQIEPASGKRTDLQPSDGTDTRSGAAREAGLSERQKVTALRVANVPAAEFERAIESDRPTIGGIADIGRKPAPKPLVDLQGRDPEEFAISTQGQGVLREFAAFAAKTDARLVARGALPDEFSAMRQHIAAIDGWLDQLVVALEA